MSEAIGQPGQAALPRPLGIGEILSTAFELYRRHWRTLLAIAAVVVVPLTLLQYLFGDWIRSRGEITSLQQVSTATWAVGAAGLVAALAGILMYLVLTGAITRAVAAEVAGEDPSVEQSYRFGFHRLGSVLLVSVLVGLATIAGLILFIIPGIWIGVRLAVSVEALVVEGRRGTQAMGRSWELVGGHWWHAFGALVVAGAAATTVSRSTSWLTCAPDSLMVVMAGSSRQSPKLFLREVWLRSITNRPSTLSRCWRELITGVPQRGHGNCYGGVRADRGPGDRKSCC